MDNNAIYTQQTKPKEKAVTQITLTFADGTTKLLKKGLVSYAMADDHGRVGQGLEMCSMTDYDLKHSLVALMGIALNKLGTHMFGMISYEMLKDKHDNEHSE